MLSISALFIPVSTHCIIRTTASNHVGKKPLRSKTKKPTSFPPLPTSQQVPSSMGKKKNHPSFLLSFYQNQYQGNYFSLGKD